MKRLLLTLIAFIALLYSDTRAQTPLVVVPPGQPFNIEFNSPYPNVATDTRFRAWIDNLATKFWTQTELTATPVTDLTQCYGTATPPAGATCFLYRGLHPALGNQGVRNMNVTAVDVVTGLDSPRSPTVQFVVGTLKMAPTNPRVVVVVTQAGVQFEFKSVPVTVEPLPNQRATVRIPVTR